MNRELGPVSAFLESDVRRFIQRHGIVLWLDADELYSGFVDRLAALRAAGELPYKVRGFRGSYIELLFSLESLTNGVDKGSLLVHLPGFNPKTVVTTPLLELYCAGSNYPARTLDRLVADAAGGRVPAPVIEDFVKPGVPSLAAADAWLTHRLAGPGPGVLGGTAVAALAAQLAATPLDLLITDLLDGGLVAAQTHGSEATSVQTVVWQRLVTATGAPTDWEQHFRALAAARPEALAAAAASWALCVEYVHDLRRPPVIPSLQAALGLPKPVIDACRHLAQGLRQRRSDFYRRLAGETEALLGDEVAAARAEDLGEIDTFQFEEDHVLRAAMDALDAQRWPEAAAWAAGRVDTGSFWTQQDPARRSAWLLVQAAARLGSTITAAGPTLGDKNPAAGALELGVEAYVMRGAAVDQAHRQLEQLRTRLVETPDLHHLRQRLDGVRALWRTWADDWARDWNARCQGEGFLPPAPLQQRTLFDDVVRPLCQQSGPTALFVVDAFRYEMALELSDALGELPATQRQLRARLAELPTVTEVGMNVLAPVTGGGKLRPVFRNGRIDGFFAGEFRVSDPETRQRAMRDRVGGGTCPWLTLAEVIEREPSSLKQAVARAKLVVVHSTEIDTAGEKGLGTAVFDHVLQQLRHAWRLLREAGVRRFVFTADHGFLLLDEHRQAQTHGRPIDPKRRHVYTQDAVDYGGEVRVGLGDLGYAGEDIPNFVIFPTSTAVFDQGSRRQSFVHGGNSPQERVIPVLTLEHRAAAGVSTVQYRAVAWAQEAVAGMHCLAGRVEIASQGVLDFGGQSELELALRVTEPWPPDVQVELCQARGAARLRAGAIVATVGQPFELFFRLTSSNLVDARVRVQLQHAGAESDVVPGIVEERYAVAAIPTAAAAVPAAAARLPGRAWLDELPAGPVRELFAHLTEHGAVTEIEAAQILGGARALRQFSRQFDTYCKKSPFVIRIDVVAGVKRYVRADASEETTS